MARTKKKTAAQLQSEIDKILTRVPPRPKTANVIVYSRPSGYWYAQAREPKTGTWIADASGHSRAEALQELTRKFAMIGVTVLSVTTEDPYTS